MRRAGNIKNQNAINQPMFELSKSCLRGLTVSVGYSYQAEVSQ